MLFFLRLRIDVLARASLIFAALHAAFATGASSAQLLRREDSAAAGRADAAPPLANSHAVISEADRRDFDEYLLARWHDHTKQHLLNSLSQSWGQALEEVGQVSNKDRSKATAAAKKAVQHVSIGALSDSAPTLPRTICETGFGAEHPSMTFLANTKATIYDFSENVGPRATPAASFIQTRFPGRVRHIWGNSSVTMPSFRDQKPDVQCDLLVLGGGSTSQEAKLVEFKHFAGMASRMHLLALDSNRCTIIDDEEVCGTGASQAWMHLKQRGCIHELEFSPKTQEHGFHLGQFVPCALWNGPGGVPMSAIEVSANIHNEDVKNDDHRQRLDQHLLGLARGRQSLNDAFVELEKMLKDKRQRVSEGHIEARGVLELQTDRYDEWAHNPNISTVCESGFGAGHSALRFLAQTKNTTVISFDNGQHPYTKEAAALLSGKFGNRFQINWGDSRQTITRFHNAHRSQECDLIIVDGGNDPAAAYEDLGNFAALAARGHILAIDDTPCNAGYCVGPTQAWRALIDEGCIVEKEAIQMGLDRGFTIGEYRECPYWPNLYLGARISAS